MSRRKPGGSEFAALFHASDLSRAEVAARLGCPERLIGVWLSRGDDPVWRGPLRHEIEAMRQMAAERPKPKEPKGAIRHPADGEARAIRDEFWRVLDDNGLPFAEAAAIMGMDVSLLRATAHTRTVLDRLRLCLEVRKAEEWTAKANEAGARKAEMWRLLRDNRIRLPEAAKAMRTRPPVTKRTVPTDAMMGHLRDYITARKARRDETSALIRDNGLTQHDAAMLAGVSVPTLRGWISEKDSLAHRAPGCEVVARLRDSIAERKAICEEIRNLVADSDSDVTWTEVADAIGADLSKLDADLKPLKLTALKKLAGLIREYVAEREHEAVLAKGGSTPRVWRTF